jgi:Bacterial Ig domain
MSRVALALLAALAFCGVGASGADFTASSASPTTITAASDFNTVAVTLGTVNPALSGTVALTATATSNRGIASVAFQYSVAGAGNWVEICSDATASYGCSWNTAALADGSYDVRALATDTAGYTRTDTRAGRTVDNTAPSATPSTPTTGSGTVTMTVSVSDSGSGIAYVKWEALYQGTWYEFCRDTAAPYECSGNSAQVPDGTYSIRVTTVDNAGMAFTSPQSSITIDNTRPAGSSISTTGAGAGVAGRLDQDDVIQLTWSEPIAPASVLTGWNGSNQPIRVRVREAAGNDQMDFLTTGGIRLNLVLGPADLTLGGNYVTADTDFDATMTQSGATITITLGTQLTGTVVTAAAGTLSWKPSSAAKDLAGNASTSGTVNEGGTADVDF